MSCHANCCCQQPSIMTAVLELQHLHAYVYLITMLCTDPGYKIPAEQPRTLPARYLVRTLDTTHLLRPLAPATSCARA